ncbi:hypothetical protein J6N69_00345 [bacterium]|nr:hypothetical protein [bacterium]
MSHRKQSKRNKLNEFIKNIFSIKSTYDKSHKIFTLLGIKLKVKNMSYKHAMYRKFLILHEILKYIGYIKYRKEIYKNKKARICVCLHLYYMNSWEKIKKYLKNLSPYKYDLYVSCCKGNYNQKTLNKIKKFKKDVKITIFPNIGYDVGSFIETINNIDLNNYDIVFKIHSKGVKRPYIYIYNQIFKYADWFHNLYEGILGEFTVHETIDKLMNNKNIGLTQGKQRSQRISAEEILFHRHRQRWHRRSMDA